MIPIFTISFLVFGIWITMQEGMIFEKMGDAIHNTLGEFWAKPVAKCVICMTFWYGTMLYWLIYGVSWQDWLITVVAAMGFNTILTKLFPDK